MARQNRSRIRRVSAIGVVVAAGLALAGVAAAASIEDGPDPVPPVSVADTVVDVGTGEPLSDQQVAELEGNEARADDWTPAEGDDEPVPPVRSADD